MSISSLLCYEYICVCVQIQMQVSLTTFLLLYHLRCTEFISYSQLISHHSILQAYTNTYFQFKNWNYIFLLLLFSYILLLYSKEAQATHVLTHFHFEKRERTECMHAKSLQSCPTLCMPMDCSPPGFSVDGDSPGKNTGVSCHALLQGIFQTQVSNPCLLCLLHWQGVLQH